MDFFELISACEKGNIDYIQTHIDTQPRRYLNAALFYACKHGKKDIVELLIIKGANDWNGGLDGACDGNQLELAEYMINKGAYDFNSALFFSKSLEITQLLVNHGANDWNKGLRGACNHGNKQLINYMIEHGANDWNYGVLLALQNKHRDIAKLMIKHGATNWNGIFSAASKEDLDYLLPTITARKHDMEYQLKELNTELENRKRKHTEID
jgi:ankyrin repeat protein